MFHFPRFARARLSIQRAVRRHYPPWVSPFGHLRIKAWLAAPRSLSQLPASFFASCRLGIHRVPFPAWSEDQGPARSLRPVVNRRGAPVTLVPSTTLSCAYAVVKDRKSTWWSRSGSNRRLPACKAGALPTELRPRWLVGLDRFELSTPRLSSVCSNQLSYRPSPLQAPPDSGSTADLQRAEGCPFGPSRLDASPRKANCDLT